MELQNGGEEIRQEKRRKKVEKWWRNDEEMQWRKVKWGRRKPKLKTVYPPPFFGLYTAATWPAGFTGRIRPVNPGQKALWAVYSL